MILRALRHRVSAIGSHPTSRAARGITLVLAVGIGWSCTSAEERCRDGQNAAQSAWVAYQDALAARRATIVAAQAKVQQAQRDVSGRIGAIASEATHRLYDPGPAWQRQYEVAFIQACRRDTECAALEKERTRVDTEATTLDARIAAVTTARNQALAAPKAAWSAAQRVEVEVTDPLSTAAEQAARDAANACDVALP